LAKKTFHFLFEKRKWSKENQCQRPFGPLERTFQPEGQKTIQ